MLRAAGINAVDGKQIALRRAFAEFGFFLVFLPVAGFAAFTVQSLHQLLQLVVAPFRWIRRRFLLKRDTGSVICEFDLSDMRDYIAVLSGRANTVRFAAALRAELGEDPATWLPVFMERYHEARD